MGEIGFDGARRADDFHIGKWIALLLIMDLAIWLACFRILPPDLLAQIISPFPFSLVIPAILIGNLPFALNVCVIFYFDLPERADTSKIAAIIFAKIVSSVSFFAVLFISASIS
jgi:hypothetical protein